MNTANLSVGIDTSAAFAALKALRAEMQTQPHNLLINVDPKSVDREISGYLKSRKFTISVNTSKMGADIENDVGLALDRAFAKEGRKLSWNQAALRGGMNAAIDGVFDDKQRRLRYDRERLVTDLRASVDGALAYTHKINIDQLNLTAQVTQAVQTGLSAGGVVNIKGATGSVAAAPSGSVDAIKSTIRDTLVPAVDRMVLAADQIAAAARRTSVGGTVGTANAKRTISAVGPDGFTTSFSEKLENPDAILPTIQLRKAELALTKEQLAAEKALFQSRNALVNQRVQEIGQVEALRAKSASNISVETLLGLPSRESMKSFGAQIAAQMRDGVATEMLRTKSASNISVETLLGLPSRDVTKSFGAQIAAQMRDGVRTELLRARSASNIDPNILLGLPSRDSMKSFGAQIAAQMREGVKTEALRAKSASSIDATTLLGLPSRAEMKSMGAQIAAQMREGVKLDKQGWTYGPDRSTMEAAQAAARLAQANKSVKASVVAVSDAHKVFTGTMREAHSAARGLAGSMGAMWATYGSVVPLVAAAGLGAALRNVFTVGKEVEYQLAFVSALSNETAVSVESFGRAIRGSMVMPVEAAQAMRGLAQNGLSVAESLRALPDILALATAGEMSLSDAALGATGVMAAFNLQVNDLGRVGDVFAKAAAISNTSVQSMVESMKQASTVGDQFHVTIEETAASLAVLAQRNIIGTAGGTALRNMLTELYSPTKKAQEAMKQLGLQLYDSNNQLLPYREALKKLHDVVVMLDEKGRTQFLTTLFNERGVKAASALLSDLSAFGLKFEEISNKSDGFSKSIVAALGDTTAGKIKKLFSEFELASDKAFNSANAGLKGMIDAVRIFVNSSGFQEALTGLVSGVSSLTRFLVDNASAVTGVVAAWVGLKALAGAITLFQGLRVAIAGATTTMATFGAVASTALGVATGGIAIVVALAAQYLLMRDNVSELSKALIAETDALRMANDEADSHVKRLGEQNAVLERQNELMWQGVSAIEAKKRAEDELVGKQGASKQNDVAAMRAEVEKLKLDVMNSEQRDFESAMSNGGMVDTTGTAALRRELEIREKLLAERERALELYTAEQREKRINKEQMSVSKMLEEVENFNRMLGERKEKKVSITVEKIDLDFAKHMKPEEVQAEIKYRTTELNKQLNKFTAPDPEADRAARASILADVDARKAANERAIREMEAKYKTEDLLLKARHSAGLIATEEYEIRLRAVAERHSKDRVDLAKKEYDDIQAIANRPGLKPEDKKKIETDLANAKAKAEQANVDELNRAAVAAIEMEGALKKAADNSRDLQMKHAVADMKALRDMAASLENFSIGSNRQMGPQADQQMYGSAYVANLAGSGLSAAQREAQSAQNEATRRDNYEKKLERKYNADSSLKGSGAKDTTLKAALAAYDEYANDILALEKKLAKSQDDLARVNQKRAQLQGVIETDVYADAAAIQAELDTLERTAAQLAGNIGVARTEVSALEAMREHSVNTRAQAAKDLYEYERSAEAGMMSFWKQYRNEATNTAKLVDNVMSQTFSSMEQGLMKFVTTGKWNFKDFARSVLADAARMVANKALQQVLGMALNFVMGAAGGGAGTTSGAGSVGVNGDAGISPIGSGGGGGVAFAAKGGVFTENGPLPLRYYARGGIEYGPAVTVHGEGSLPEANIPLPDGRTVPVTLQGGIGGGGNTQVNMSIHIDSNGKSAVESDTSGNKAQEFGRMAEEAMLALLEREKRPGGVLYS